MSGSRRAERVRAEATVRKDGPDKGVRAEVPFPVRQKFGLMPGDKLVFVEGGGEVPAAFALRGYFLLSYERGAPPAEAPRAEEAAAPPALESFEDAVRKKRQGG